MSRFPPFGEKWGRFTSLAHPDFDTSMIEAHPHFGIPMTRIGNCACAPWMNPFMIDRLQHEWMAREDDVFVVSPVPPMECQLLAYSAALIEQKRQGGELTLETLGYTRWVDAAVSYRGWEYLEILDRDFSESHRRRCLMTHAAPWTFPCSNSGLPAKPFPSGWKSSAWDRQSSTSAGSGRSSTGSFGGSDDSSASSTSSSSSSSLSSHSSASPTASWSIGSEAARGSSCSSEDGSGAGQPRIAIFVGDPRYMIMRELHIMQNILTSSGRQIDDSFTEILDGLMQPCQDLLPGFGGGSITTCAAWAEVEARFPDRIRIFFVEDFVMQPEVAMRGLARFVEAPSISQETEAAIAWAKGSAEAQFGQQAALLAGEPSQVSNFGNVIEAFERRLVSSSGDLQAAWEDLARLWLLSPNKRMASMAQSALDHDPWNPRHWWAAHSARVCRPCLYFPRGQCHSDDCGYCHGPDHPKPKRPPMSRRRRRKGCGASRTPSPPASRIATGEVVEVPR